LEHSQKDASWTQGKTILPLKWEVEEKYKWMVMFGRKKAEGIHI
jgi:hypothetical protein